ncbi:MFS transporter [Paenibacillus sp. JCM 10914]|uniref:MFS transporter n=1 Tax=Paenibacillus sp. JCM 10914 TaxID=1236974 RepID=UPI0003CC83D1|nr:MFS transporter [Paenibacillus sp. JCM 10914]GAE07180.1 major facilitator family transporter [Paenibacillus sp. JCM 10914]
MERLWTKPFIQMTVSMLFLFTGFYLLLPTMPLYIKELGGTESQVGLAAGAFTLAAVVFRPFVGAMLDRHGRRIFYVWGLIAFVICMYSYTWATGIFLLLALRMLHGVSWAFSTTAVGTVITDLIPASRRGEGMGWYGMAMTVAMAIGPLVGTSLLEGYSFHTLFLVAFLLSMVALILAYITKAPFQAKSSTGRIQLLEKSVLPVTVALFFLAVAYGGITTFLPLFASSIHVNPGAFFLVYAIALTLVRPLAGKLSDRFGEAKVIMPSLILTAAALLILSLSNGWFGLITAAILYGVGFGSAQPALQAATLRIAPDDRRGAANASFMTAFDLGIGLGAIGLGWVSEFSSYSVLFTVTAISVLVSFLIFTLFVRRLLRVTSDRTNTSH